MYSNLTLSSCGFVGFSLICVVCNLRGGKHAQSLRAELTWDTWNITSVSPPTAGRTCSSQVR